VNETASIPTIFWLAGFVMIVLLGVSALREAVTRERVSNRELSLRNRIANFVCCTCHSPLCIPAASRSNIQMMSRRSREWEEVDKSDWTMRQQTGDTAIWIRVECLRCSEINVFDDEGNTAKLPTVPSAADLGTRMGVTPDVVWEKAPRAAINLPGRES
jgi:hypothetical protein